MKRNRRYPEKIIQFGEGNFLRCFADWQIDILNEMTDFNSGITIIRPIDYDNIPLLDTQQGLYTTIIRGINENGDVVKDYRLIQSVNREIPIYKQFDEYLALAENPDIKWVISNTTEAGIVFDKTDRYEDKPQSTFPGKLTRLLHERYNVFKGEKSSGFTIIPCELIDYNGELLKEIVFKYADLWKLEDSFKIWLLEANTWCSTLVDRIVTGFPFSEKDELEKELGYKDNFITTGEYFYLFVIQGPKSLENELKLDKLDMNIKIVDDIRPYKQRKVGILNGAHTLMVPVAYLYGLNTVKESIEDDIIGEYVKRAVFDEIIPALDMDEAELKDFAYSVIDRFRNPYIKHMLMSISLNSMSKYKSRVLPQVLSYYKKYNKLPKRLIFSLAALIRFYKGTRGEEKIELKDEQYILDFYKELWKNSNNDYKNIAEKTLELEKLWEINLTSTGNILKLISEYIKIIDGEGIKKTLETIKF